MSKPICDKCGKEFANKGTYTKHINRKNPCVVEIKNQESEVFEKNEFVSSIELPTGSGDVASTEPIQNTMIPVQLDATRRLKFIDLFCGIGSFHYSFKKFDWECVMSCDIDKAVKETYKTNYGLMPLDDITKIEPENVPAFDILCAGFPCQPFSQCGLHKGFDDKRGTLFFNIMKFVEHHRPQIIILENVRGLLNHNGGNTFKRIQDDIKSADYSITFKVIKCSDYGLPQMRKRLIIVGIRNDTKLVKYIDKLLDFEEYTQEKTLSQLLGKRFEKDIAYTIRCGGRNSPINDKHNWDGYMVDGKEYRLTKEDCLKIQGFDADFKLCGNNNEQWRQLGNTIPTRFTEIIGLNINKYLMMC